MGSVVVTCLGGCSQVRRLAYTPRELRAEIHRRAPAMLPADQVVPFEVSPQQVALARKAINPFMSNAERAKALLDALFDPDYFGLRYAEVLTRNARETIETHEGNCLSLASVYVGLARALGLRAYFLDASDRVEEEHQEQDMLVKTGHITAVVETERGRVALDFGRRLSPFRIFRIMDDMEAIAHFHNNYGYELIHQALDQGRDIDWARVARSFEAATRVLPTFAQGWNNLGVARARLRDRPGARAAYQRAIALDPEFASPLTNLGILYYNAADNRRALSAFRRAAAVEPDNARVQYHLALALDREGQTAVAETTLVRALELDPRLTVARRLLADLYRRQGRQAEALRLEAAAPAAAPVPKLPTPTLPVPPAELN